MVGRRTSSEVHGWLPGRRSAMGRGLASRTTRAQSVRCVEYDTNAFSKFFNIRSGLPRKILLGTMLSVTVNGDVDRLGSSLFGYLHPAQVVITLYTDTSCLAAGFAQSRQDLVRGLHPLWTQWVGYQEQNAADITGRGFFLLDSSEVVSSAGSGQIHNSSNRATEPGH